MRLIDADELKKHIRRCDDSATRATFDYVYEDDIDDAPTVCDIEQIIIEITQIDDKNGWIPIDEVFNIILKYTKGDKE